MTSILYTLPKFTPVTSFSNSGKIGALRFVPRESKHAAGDAPLFVVGTTGDEVIRAAWLAQIAGLSVQFRVSPAEE